MLKSGYQSGSHAYYEITMTESLSLSLSLSLTHTVLQVTKTHAVPDETEEAHADTVQVTPCKS